MKNYRSIAQRDKKLNADFIGLCSIILPTIFAGISLATINLTHAEGETSVNKTAVVHVESSCSMSQTVDTDTAHTVEINSGQYKDDIGTSSFYATCNDMNGYSIYAIGYSGETEGNTAMLASAPLTTSSNIQTGTSGTDSYWAVKLTAGSNVSIENSFSSFHIIPSDYTRVAKRASGTSSNALAFTSTYKISLANNQPAGSYNGAVKYILINPTMSQEDLPEGYEINSQGQLAKTVFGGITTMQQMTPAICDAETTPSASDTKVPTKQLIDTRDNKLYWVAKLADGNCWMTQNLDLELDSSVALTDELTDLNSKTSWTPNRNTQNHQYKTADGTIDTDAKWNSDYNTIDHSYRPASDVAAGTSGKFGTDTDTYFSPVFMQNGTTMASWKTMADCTGAGNSAETCAHWSVGTFYSWRAATAGSGDASVTTVTNVPDSICPKGWHLPTSTSTGEFQNLVTKAGLTASNITGAPYYFLRSGDYAGSYGAVYTTGNRGNYWSSTSYSGTSYAYSLDFSSSGVNPSYVINRYYGMSVRCVATGS